MTFESYFSIRMVSSEYLLIYAILLILFTTIAFCGILYATTQPYPKLWRDEKERHFINPKTDTTEIFPSLDDDWSVHLSIIVPAYNEQQRLPSMLDECLEYLEQRTKTGFKYEVIIVSDGSTDKTVAVAQKYALKYDSVRVLSLIKNRGKGGAVRLGMLSARGSTLLFVDADGATKFQDIEKLEESLRSTLQLDYISNPGEASVSAAVVCGSRAHLDENDHAKRSFFRWFLMQGFHFLVCVLCVRGIKDTQCGFKLLTRNAARTIFQALHVERWAFDVEMLYIAQTLHIPITEIPVNWTEVEGSKIVPVWSWLQMGLDLVLIWLKYRIGAWRISKLKES